MFFVQTFLMVPKISAAAKMNIFITHTSKFICKFDYDTSFPHRDVAQINTLQMIGYTSVLI